MAVLDFIVNSRQFSSAFWRYSAFVFRASPLRTS